MEKQAAEICVISPSQQLADMVRKIAPGIADPIDICVCYLDEAVELARNFHRRGTRVFVSRKGTKAVVEENLHVPVVGIDITINDYVRVLRKVKEFGGKAGFFSYAAMPEEIWALCDLLDIDMQVYRFTNSADTEEGIRQAIADGVKIVVGGSLTRRHAQQHGLPSIVVENSEETLANALLTATQILAIQKDEEKKQMALKVQIKRYETFFNYTHDGIIAVDEKGRIVVLNKMAENIIGLKNAIYVNRDIREVIPNSQAQHVLKNGRTELNQLMEMNGTLVSTNRIPIVIDGEVKGAVFTFMDVKGIQDRERKIRIKLHEKGLFAKHSFDEIIGESEAIRNAKAIAESYARSESTIMILGETGTGKELFAQSMHNAGGHKNAPFLAVNCAALPKHLMEAELFGYEEGAFTGAVKGGKQGLFESAHGGTIFLDEIGEMPLETQAHLLRVLQEKEIRRVGGDKVIPIDIRVITATNRDLSEAVAKGMFRQDLFFRLDVLRLDIPPLRERLEDIPALADAMLRRLDKNIGTDFLNAVQRAINTVQGYLWPGNVRELENFVERLFVLQKHGDGGVALQNLTDVLHRNSGMSHDQKEAGERTQERDLSAWERERVLSALKRNNLVLAKTAKELCISRTTLWRRVKQLGIRVK